MKLIALPIRQRGTKPNKSQTMVNIVTAMGPIAREDLVKVMAELFGEDFHRMKQLILPLLWHLTCKGTLKEDDGTKVISLPRSPRSTPSTSRRST